MTNVKTTNTLTRRETVARLARASNNGLITPAQAARVLGWSDRLAAARLQRLSKQGWLARAQRGVYFVRQLEATGDVNVAEDPWLVANNLFEPCYIGGWSAAEHWGLTEQLFRSTFVISAAGRRKKNESVLGAEFRIVRVPTSRVETVGMIWRGSTRLRVSDRERTLADALDHPSWIGGVRHLAEMMGTYRTSELFQPDKILQELESLHSGAGIKRLGFLAERVWRDANVAERALKKKTTGVVRLDPAVPERGPINSRWGLSINVEIDVE